MKTNEKATTTILLIEDDERDRKMLLEALREKYNVEVAVDYSQAKEKINRCSFNVVFLDLMLPIRQGGKIEESGKLGLELLKIVREKEPLIPVVVISALTSVKTAMKILKEGIVDFIVKDDLEDQLPLIMRRAELIRKGQIENLILRHECQRPVGGFKLVYRSKVMVKIVDQVQLLAQGDASVLLMGETGTGKELIAREIHARSPRAAGPFVAVNCGAIPATLIESELFGHEKGAFTGADRRKVGLFELAYQGTLFLDEITDLPSELQVKLLRVLQERSFRRVGGEKELPVNIRVIAATNKDVSKEIEAGRFRKDLFYRVGAAQLNLPPLRKRREDIEVLVEYLIQRFEPGSSITIAANALKHLADYDWPGNVRELENVIQRLLIFGSKGGGAIQLRDVHDCLPDPNRNLIKIPDDIFSLDEVKRRVIIIALERFGNQQEAAEHLCISESQLRRKINDYGIEYRKTKKAHLKKGKRKSNADQRRLKIVQMAMERGEITTQDVMKLLGNVSRKTATAYLNSLMTDGELERITRGKYRVMT